MISSHAEVGGWVGVVKSDIPRPHVPVEKIPPAGFIDETWLPVTRRDPLGLTPKQRAAEPDIQDVAMRFVMRMRDNMAAWDALPDGTLISCWCGAAHPVEMYR